MDAQTGGILCPARAGRCGQQSCGRSRSALQRIAPSAQSQDSADVYFVLAGGRHLVAVASTLVARSRLL